MASLDLESLAGAAAPWAWAGGLCWKCCIKRHAGTSLGHFSFSWVIKLSPIFSLMARQITIKHF